MSGLEPLVIASLVGTAATVGATVYAGQQTQQASYEAAHRAETAGKAEFASSQRDAEERRLEGKLVQSRQQALAAASGGGASSEAPTIVRLMTETAKRTELGVQSALFGGRQRKQTYFDNASAQRQSGDASFLGSILTGIGQFSSGIAKVQGA